MSSKSINKHLPKHRIAVESFSAFAKKIRILTMCIFIIGLNLVVPSQRSSSLSNLNCVCKFIPYSRCLMYFKTSYSRARVALRARERERERDGHVHTFKVKCHSTQRFRLPRDPLQHAPSSHLCLPTDNYPPTYCKNKTKKRDRKKTLSFSHCIYTVNNRF